MAQNLIFWRLKLQLKVFIWLLHKGVILTKDNLIRRRWQGSKLVFVQRMKQYVIFLLSLCKFPLEYFLVTFGLQPPFNVAHMFSSWLNGVEKTIKHQILVGVCALCWALWLSWNDIVFDKQS